jgi:hypothetical protein
VWCDVDGFPDCNATVHELIEEAALIACTEMGHGSWEGGCQVEHECRVAAMGGTKVGPNGLYSNLGL